VFLIASPLFIEIIQKAHAQDSALSLPCED